MRGKKLLVLGGAEFQVPLIEKAREMGLYVITCDYLPSNPGHSLAHEYHNVSTTDKEAILKVARECHVDAITSFCSDPAVPTVAYVADRLGLPGPSKSAIEHLTEKDKFRKLMHEAGLNTPLCHTVLDGEIPEGLDHEAQYIVKPVDSSGSKGITQSTGNQKCLQRAVDYALCFSRSGRCIVEGFIEGKQVHGDAFVKKGKVVYCYLGDHYFYTGSNSFVPISTRWPAGISDTSMRSVIDQVERILDAAGYDEGPVNIEARVDSEGRVYIIEIGPRNGGNFVPIIQQRLSGFDFVQAVINTALGLEVKVETFKDYKPGAYYIIHAHHSGIFSGLEIDSELQDMLFFTKLFKQEGEKVELYTGSNQTIGVCLFEASNNSLLDRVFQRAPKALVN